MTYTSQALPINKFIKSTVAIPSWAQEMIDHPEGRNNTTEAYAKVPQLYRAVSMRANALACVPFVVRKNNKITTWPFPQHLNRLLGEMEASLMVTGGAYALKSQPASGGTRTVGIQFLPPTTMTAKYDSATRQTSYTQRIGANTYGPWDSSRMWFMREFSFTSEIGNGLAPAQVALPAANLRSAMQEFASGFFSSGGQPMTLLTVAGNPPPTELDRTERFFKRSMQGVRNAWRVLAMRSEVTVQPITPELNTMAMPDLQETTTREIAAAFGIPLSLLTSDSANYATAQSDMRLFYENTVKARLMMYQVAINEQLLAEMGMSLEFTPEALSIYQEDEAERSGALVNLVQAGMPLISAMLILGYSVEEVTGVQTSAEIAPPSTYTAPPANVAKSAVEPDNDPWNDTDSTVDDDTWSYDEYGVVAYEQNAQTEIKAWAKVAGKDRARALEFDCDHIVPELETWIKDALAKDGIDITQIFDHVPTKAARLTDREQRKVASVVTGKFKEYSGRITSAAAGGKVDYKATLKLFNAMADDLAPVIERAYTKQFARIINGVSPASRPNTYRASALEAAQNYTGTELQGQITKMTQTTVKNLKRVITKIAQDPSLTRADIDAKLFPTFGKYRAAAIAATEVTRAKSAASNDAFDLLVSNGEDVTRRWETEAGACNICTPLDGASYKTYSKQYEGGPPAHTNCRCDIVVELKT